MIYKHCQKILLASLASLPFPSLQADVPAYFSLSSPSSESLSQDILNIFKEYVLLYDIDKKSAGLTVDQAPSIPFGFDSLLKKIHALIIQNKPILLTLVGFPYKSSNIKDKVLSTKADGAERYALTYLQGFLNKIKKVYPPGATLMIFTDGFVFCDLEKVSDNVVIQYEDDLKTLAKDLPDIKVITMRDLCPGKTPAEIRQLLAKEEPSFESFKATLAHTEKCKDDVDVFTKWMAMELALLNLSEEERAMIAFKETHRGRQFSQFLKTYRPKETIACSVHYQKDVGAKVGLKLSNSDITPWHGVLVEMDEGPHITHLNTINMSDYNVTTQVVNDLPIVSLARRR
ncbi:MAG: isocyanide synthase family protein [Alphaproteobacteria bacterium]|nr:isocyanide synthase family protein [Alphaproteobacteria bacterium]